MITTLKQREEERRGEERRGEERREDMKTDCTLQSRIIYRASTHATLRR
jgi:hypothetical protein